MWTQNRSEKWSADRKALLVLFLAAVIATALTACSAGFKNELLDPKKKPSTGPGSTPVATVPLQTVQNSGYIVGASDLSPLVELAASQSPEIAAILANQATRKDVKSEASVGFALAGLKASNSYSGTESVLYVTVRVTLGTQTAATLLVSDKAEMLISSPGFVEISGYWTMSRGSGKAPIYFTLNSQVTISGNMEYKLKGRVFMNADGSDYSSELIPQFERPICELIVDTTWLSQFYQSTDYPPSCL